MANPPLWFVRADEGGVRAGDFRSTQSVGIGWTEVGPISPEIPDEQIDSRFADAYPQKEEKTRNAWAYQVRRFLREIRVDDRVMTYDPSERAYLLGQIKSDAEWREGVLPRRRAVTWTHRVDRDALSENARNKLGSIGTLFQVGPEAEAELLQNAMPLFGDLTGSTLSVRGQRAPALTRDDFDVLRRNPRSVPWPTLPEADRAAIKNLRQRLLQYAVKLKDELGSSITLKPFASHPTPSGRNASLYWACVYPQNAPNKSFAFQLFVIVRPEIVEYGFGSGSATGEINESKLDELRTQFELQRERLKRLRDLDWLSALSEDAIRSGFKMRSRWMQPDGASEFNNVPQWIDHASSADGGGAAISKTIRPDEALDKGDRFADLLVRELKRFVPLLDAIYSDARPAEAPTPLPAVMPRPALTIEWLVEETLWDRGDIETVLDTLTQQTPQIILAGPPGTSKTWIAELFARYLTQDRPGQFKTVQFHPSYSYEEFVEGLRPQTKDGNIAFEPHKGTILRLCAGLTPESDYRVLVIDEMNRANLPKVFGELLYLLEYRDRPVDLQYSLGFRLPRKLLLIGTMNTADRSIRSIDVALRRRFDVFECPPSSHVLERYYSSRVNDVADLVSGFEALNASLEERLDRHHKIGHAFLMADPMTPARLQHIWKHKIGPLIEEYFFDQPDVAKDFQIARFWPSVTNAAD
jgi:hypothetical protein